MNHRWRKGNDDYVGDFSRVHGRVGVGLQKVNSTVDQMSFLRLVQRRELDILRAVVEVCEENNLTYYISGGTFLGAVRHHGFIPWDDDIDVALPRDDYEKLARSLLDALPSPFEAVTCRNSEDYFYPKIQVRDPRVLVRMTDHDRYVAEPCWIDVFPLDGAPKPGLRREFWKLKLRAYELMWGVSRVDHASDRSAGRSLSKQSVIKFAKAFRLNSLLDAKKWTARREGALKSYSFVETGYCVNAVGVYKFGSIFDFEAIYGNGAKYQFESLLLNGPADYHSYLTQIYGDYMSLPREEDRNWHGTEIVHKKKYAVGYTQGTFDMFHVGHLKLLQRAKDLCDYLIVGINSDELVLAYKNKLPVVDQGKRCEIVDCLEVVDEARIVTTLDKSEILRDVPFQVVFIGDDWKGSKRWVETEEILSKEHVSVEYLAYTEGVSSTELRERAPDSVSELTANDA